MHGTPTLKEKMQGVHWVGLDDEDYALFAKVGGGYGRVPFSAHADADHLKRTFRRNLRNDRSKLTFGWFEDGIPASIASWSVLEDLKRSLRKGEAAFLNPILHYNRFMDQNSDAANKLFSAPTIEVLEKKVEDGKIPEGKGTVFFLKMITNMTAPIEDPNFGTPFEAAKNMWRGLLAMRYWRECVRLHPSGSLERHFTSLESYQTSEVLVHGCTNYYLTAKLSEDFSSSDREPDVTEKEEEFPLPSWYLPWWRKGPTRHVADDRPLEGFFGLVRSGRNGANMSVNKTLKQFIGQAAMAQGSQAAKIRMAKLGQLVPCPKGKKSVYTFKEGDEEKWESFEEEDKKLSYQQFKEELSKAKREGLELAREDVKTWVPKIAAFLSEKHPGVWECPMPDLGVDWRKALAEDAKKANMSDDGVADAKKPFSEPTLLSSFEVPCSAKVFAETHLDAALLEKADAALARWRANRAAQGIPDFEAGASPAVLPPSPPLVATLRADDVGFTGTLISAKRVGSEILSVIKLGSIEELQHVSTYQRVLGSGSEARAVAVFASALATKTKRSRTVENFQRALAQADIRNSEGRRRGSLSRTRSPGRSKARPRRLRGRLLLHGEASELVTECRRRA